MMWIGWFLLYIHSQLSTSEMTSHKYFGIGDLSNHEKIKIIMRILIIAILLILYALGSYAQNFKKLIDINTDGVDDYTRSSVVYNDHLYFISWSRDTITNASDFLLLKSDLQGNIIDQRAIATSFNTGFESLIVVDSVLYFSDAPLVASDTSNYNLWKIDPGSLDVIDKGSYVVGPPSDGVVQDGITAYRDWILLYGDNLENPNSEGIILFVDRETLELDTTISFINPGLQYGSVLDCQEVDGVLRVMRSNGYQDQFIIEDYNEDLESISSFEMTYLSHGDDSGDWGSLLNQQSYIGLRKNGNILIGTSDNERFTFYLYDYNGRLLHRFEKDREIMSSFDLLRFLDNDDGSLTVFGRASVMIYESEPIRIDSFFTIPSDERQGLTAPYIFKLNDNQEIEFDNLYLQLDAADLNDFDTFVTLHELDDGSFLGLGSGNSTQYEERPFVNAWNKRGEVLMMRVSADGCYDQDDCVTTANNWHVLTDVSDIEEENHLVTIFPNPAYDVINIQSDNKINSIKIVSIEGRILESLTINGYTAEVNVNNLYPGIYFTIATFKGTDKIFVEKIIKQ